MRLGHRGGRMPSVPIEALSMPLNLHTTIRKRGSMKAEVCRRYFAHWLLLSCLALLTQPLAAQDKPNILVIWGDDIGVYNISAYHRGLVGGRTPNIDRIANEGALFTDSYGEQSCTAGRSSFITGQHPFRTGLLKVGRPGSPIGLSAEDPTLA